jgi:hypothetical protein
MLKNVDWGGLTIVNLLGVLAFPPYFVYLMTLAALTASGFLWTTHLSAADQQRFIDFEKEFRKGYKREKAGDREGALVWYRKLEKEYADLPQASKLATLQIEKLESEGKNPSGAPLAMAPFTTKGGRTKLSLKNPKARRSSQGKNP